MCQIAEYLRGQKDIVDSQADLIRQHQEAMSVLTIEDFALTMAQRAKFLERADRWISDLALEDPEFDGKEAMETWLALAADVLGHLRRARKKLKSAEQKGFGLADSLGEVDGAIDYLDRALVPAEASARSLIDLAKQAVRDHKAGKTDPAGDPGSW